MPRPPQPDEIAKLKGAHKKNPQRYNKTIPKSKLPLGNAPKHLSEAAKKCWDELQKLAPPGVLTGSERLMLELMSEYLAEFRENPRKFGPSKMEKIMSMLARMGMTPTDRVKLKQPKEKEEENPFEKFLR